MKLGSHDQELEKLMLKSDLNFCFLFSRFELKGTLFTKKIGAFECCSYLKKNIFGVEYFTILNGVRREM